MNTVSKQSFENALEKIRELSRENAELVSALRLVDYAIPPNWGDKCVDGVVNMDLSSDLIEAVESTLKKARGE